MYEIWLGLNIVWEIALGVWPVLLIAAVIWVALMAMAWRCSAARWRAAWPWALAAGAVVALAAFLAVPTLTKSSLGALAYWVDWASLLAIAAGFGAAALAFAWPLLSMRGTRRLSPGKFRA